MGIKQGECSPLRYRRAAEKRVVKAAAGKVRPAATTSHAPGERSRQGGSIFACEKAAGENLHPDP